jgi:pimeloyl-ACP methyl ester carboxylesterase
MSTGLRNILLLSFVLLVACHTTDTPASAPTGSPAAMQHGLVDIGGRSLHIHCAGNGDPVVVLDAGLGNDGGTWADVQPGLARFTRACVYDRAGRGYSDPGPKPRTSRLMVADLHELLVRAGIAGPYVLVGHSLGGLNVRLYESEYPGDVAGMVLVDATSDDQQRIIDLMPPERAAEFGAGMSDPEMDLSAFREAMADVRRTNRSLADKPLVVLTHGKDPPRPEWLSEDAYGRGLQLTRELQSNLARLSSNSVQVVAEDSGHFIQEDQPELVVAAVREAVEAVRTHGRVSATKLTPFARRHDPSRILSGPSLVVPG